MSEHAKPAGAHDGSGGSSYIATEAATNATAALQAVPLRNIAQTAPTTATPKRKRPELPALESGFLSKESDSSNINIYDGYTRRGIEDVTVSAFDVIQ